MVQSMNDVAPDILLKVQRLYKQLVESTKRLKALESIPDELLDYKLVHEYALLLGDILASAYQIIDARDLPNGRMYRNIAEKVLQPTLAVNHSAIAKQAVKAQEALNRKAGIQLKAISPVLNQDRINGLVSKLGEAEYFEDVRWLLGEPVVNFSQSVVDDAVRENAEFQYRSGLRPRIVRTAVASCCDWCSSLEGVYDYTGTPKDVYRRHRNCRCLVEYHPSKGVRQNAWTKKFIYDSPRSKGFEDKTFSNTRPAPFARAITKAKKSLPDDISWRVTAYGPDDYVGKKLHVTSGGSTVAVTPEGDIVSVCKAAGDKTSGRELIAEAVKNGGIKLDSYDGNHVFYQKCGFEPVSWCKWVDDYAPDDWRPEYGRENIVFYRYTGEVPDKVKPISDFYASVPASSSYDEAMELRDRLIKED